MQIHISTEKSDDRDEVPAKIVVFNVDGHRELVRLTTEEIPVHHHMDSIIWIP